MANLLFFKWRQRLTMTHARTHPILVKLRLQNYKQVKTLWGKYNFFNTFDLWLVGTWICRGSTVYNYTAHLNYRRQKKQDEMKENCWTSLMSQQGWVIELFDCKHALFSRKREDGPQRQFRGHQNHPLSFNRPDSPQQKSRGQDCLVGSGQPVEPWGPGCPVLGP